MAAAARLDRVAGRDHCRTRRAGPRQSVDRPWRPRAACPPVASRWPRRGDDHWRGRRAPRLGRPGGKLRLPTSRAAHSLLGEDQLWHRGADPARLAAFPRLAPPPEMNRPELRIRTPEGITFSYQLAGPVTRCLAWTVDLIVVIGLALALGLALGT